MEFENCNNDESATSMVNGNVQNVKDNIVAEKIKFLRIRRKIWRPKQAKILKSKNLELNLLAETGQCSSKTQDENKENTNKDDNVAVGETPSC